MINIYTIYMSTDSKTTKSPKKSSKQKKITVSVDQNATSRKLTKDELFQDEQKQVLDKLMNVIGITKDDNLLYSELLEEKEMQKKIDDIVPDIKKYFHTSTWSCFTSNKTKKKHLSIILAVLRTLNIKHERFYVKTASCKILKSGVCIELNK